MGSGGGGWLGWFTFSTPSSSTQIEWEVSQKRPTGKGYEYNQGVKRQHADGENASEQIGHAGALLPVFEDHHERQKNPAQNTHTLFLFHHINKSLIFILAKCKIICNNYRQFFTNSLYFAKTGWCHDETGLSHDAPMGVGHGVPMGVGVGHGAPSGTPP